MFSTNLAADEARIVTRKPVQDNGDYFSHIFYISLSYGPARLRDSPAGTFKLVIFSENKRNRYKCRKKQ